MFCPNCGQQIPDQAKFCPSCGAPIIRPAGSFSEKMDNAKKAVNEAADTAAGVLNEAADSVSEAADKAADAAEQAMGTAKEKLNDAADSVDAAVKEFETDFENNFNGNQPQGSGTLLPLRTDRSLLAYVLLSIITCGIYGYYFIFTVARDINTACEDDDEETAGLGMYILLSFITCGFYNLYWEYKLGNRLAKNGPYFGVQIQENGTTILLWKLIGSLVCGIGYFIGSYILIRNVNTICTAYNQKHGL